MPMNTRTRRYAHRKRSHTVIVTGNDTLAKKTWKKAMELAKGNKRLLQVHSPHDITVHNNENWQMNRNLHAIENRNEDHKLDLLVSNESERNQSRTYPNGLCPLCNGTIVNKETKFDKEELKHMGGPGWVCEDCHSEWANYHDWLTNSVD